MLYPTRQDYMRVPESLRVKNKRWCCFRCIPQPDGHIKKFPISPFGDTGVGSNGRKVWSKDGPKINPDLFTFDECMTAVEYGVGNALGYAVRKDNGLIVIDLDGAILPDGNLSETAVDMLSKFKPEEIYIERSISGNGIHIICWYTGPPLHGVVKPGVEMYSDQQFVILTGIEVPNGR